MTRRRGGDDGAEIYRDVGARIRKARGTTTQNELADLVGLTRTSITNIERGRQKVLLHTFLRIAAALEVPAHELLPVAIGKAPPPLQLPQDPREKAFVAGAIEAVSGGSTRRRSR